MHTSRGLRMSRFRRGVITTVALVIVLAGCTDEPIGPDPGPASAPPTATPSPTPTPIAAPVRPDAMNTASVAGAIAAAEYFMAVYTYARQTGDLTEWGRLSANDCDFCNAVEVGVGKANDAHYTVRGAEIAVLESTGSEVTPSDFYTATLRVTESAASELDSNGAVVAAGRAAFHDLFFALSWNGGWSVNAVDVTPTPTSTS